MSSPLKGNGAPTAGGSSKVDASIALVDLKAQPEFGLDQFRKSPTRDCLVFGYRDEPERKRRYQRPKGVGLRRSQDRDPAVFRIG